MGRKSAPKLSPTSKAKPKAKPPKPAPKQLFGQDIPAVGEDDLLAAPPRNLATQNTIRGDLFNIMNKTPMDSPRMEQLIDSMQRAMMEETKAPGEGAGNPYRQAFQSLPRNKRDALVKRAANAGADPAQFKAFFGPQPSVATAAPAVDGLTPAKMDALNEANGLFQEYQYKERMADEPDFSKTPEGARILNRLDAIAEGNPDLVDLIGNEDLPTQERASEVNLVRTRRDDFPQEDQLTSYLGADESKRFDPEMRLDRRNTAKPNRRGIQQVEEIIATGGQPILPDFDNPAASPNQFSKELLAALTEQKKAGVDTTGTPVTVTEGTFGTPYEEFEALAEMRPAGDKIREHIFNTAKPSTPLADVVGNSADLPDQPKALFPLDEYAPYWRAKMNLGNGQMVQMDADTLSRVMMNKHFIGDDASGMHIEGYDPSIRHALIPHLQEAMRVLSESYPLNNNPRAQEFYGKEFTPNAAGIRQLQRQLGLMPAPMNKAPAPPPFDASMLNDLPVEGFSPESLDSIPVAEPMVAPAPSNPAELPQGDMSGLDSLINQNSMYRQRGPLLASLLA
jgi:hypothetical protein